MANVIALFQSDVFAAIMTALFLASEAIGGIPQLKQSSVYQVVFGAIKWVYGLVVKPKPPQA